jgi:hypothetical protein
MNQALYAHMNNKRKMKKKICHRLSDRPSLETNICEQVTIGKAQI